MISNDDDSALPEGDAIAKVFLSEVLACEQKGEVGVPVFV